MGEVMSNKKIILAGIFAAMVAVGTMIIHIPTPTKGYIHIGDAMVLLSGFILGPFYGFFAAAIGSFISDMMLGYATYSIPTFFIKGFDALLFSLVFTQLIKLNKESKKYLLFAFIVAGLAGGSIMVLGYLAFETVLYGFTGALLGVIPNIIQALAGAIIGAILALALKKVKKEME
jgi:uncharacterized membrane protein